MSLRRLLIISLGNPGQYKNTYHSIGHMALESLQRKFSSEQPAFASSRYGKKSVLASAGPTYTLLQSPTLMNVSGPWVAKAYRDYLADEGLSPEEVGLVIVNDDLELELGVVKVREWKASHKGHNGIKSVLASVQPAPEMRLARISIGIGRPEERDRSTVSDFVLSKVSSHARSVISEKSSLGLMDALVGLENKWR
ncbi:peptidyl-tRNA hydrolase [Bombardia bombarda]|uniref:peptidyl-tRNA hydrolase n=1 Tax=Bombardia bombarda TaxID=252184 RepID=A0AA39XML3_9PEZI|nr:peptidyl-tRNA hydrolase [Bombardia bombarda]